MSVNQSPNEPEAREIEALEALEQDIVSCKLHLWHLLWWARSPIRPLERRFRRCEETVREALLKLRTGHNRKLELLAETKQLDRASFFTPTK